MTPSNTEHESHQQIHQFIQRLKSAHLGVKNQGENGTSSFEKPLEQELISLNTIVKTLASKLQIAQNEIALLQNERQELLEKELKQTLLFQEKEASWNLEERKKIEVNTPDASLIVALKKEITTLQLLLHEKELFIQQASVHHDPTSREKSAKMALFLKSMEDELHGVQCEKNALQREIKHIGAKLKTAEESLSCLTDERDKLAQQNDQYSIDLKIAQESFASERAIRIELEKVASGREIDLFEKSECLIQALDRYQEIETLLAEKIEKEMVLQESVCILEESKELLEQEKAALIVQIEQLACDRSQLEQEREMAQKKLSDMEQELQVFQDRFYRAEKGKHTYELLLESSLQATDLIKKAQEALSRAQGNYFIQLEQDRPLENDEGTLHQLPIKNSNERPYGSSYNLF
ncbi:MAG: hypothetical protein QRY74_02420 [Chlamydia sp.]